MSAEEALRMTAYEVLEEGYFLFLDEAAGPMEEDHVAYTMDMDGAEVGIRVSRGVASALAAHMLAIEPDEVGAAEQASAVSELLNIFAGPLVARLRGVEVEIDYGIPAAGGAPHGTLVAFGTEGGGVELWYAA